ncbi:PRC-barrel domain-containing protein [Catellatospora tritici]|uniref:PRC-barrel domain-containing protein n=1 Tax=Catellatospora tritici TaxID=2851566 RepID=UPI001C2CF9EA|nr:PRC-barrel domain-containing protein [Catellatospora tritici]MBV1856683.1 PRC-barrel domain-containing protein [Catellatospora tritici]
MKASDLLGRTVVGAGGEVVGKVADLLCRRDADGVTRIDAVLVTPGRRGRLLGYERPGIQGPWLIEKLAQWLHRGTREIPWHEVRFQDRPQV